jgi:hypothetical protein
MLTNRNSLKALAFFIDSANYVVKGFNNNLDFSTRMIDGRLYIITANEKSS